MACERKKIGVLLSSLPGYYYSMIAQIQVVLYLCNNLLVDGRRVPFLFELNQ